MNLTDFAKEVHQNAVDHGWWEKEVSFGEVIALCHSELSEALQEYRAGRDIEWYACKYDERPCERETCLSYDGGNCYASQIGDKPEGIAVEMVDCLLRILDYAGNMSWTEQIERKEFVVADKFVFPDCVAELHSELSWAWAVHYIFKREPREELLCCAGKIITWLIYNYGTNWEDLAVKKHDYNKSRPYRHGGKKL